MSATLVIASLLSISSSVFAVSIAERKDALVGRLSSSLGVDAELTRKIIEDALSNNVGAERKLSSDWSWSCDSGPESWTTLGYSACTGPEQSPININAASQGYYLTTSADMPVESFVTTVNSNYKVTQSHGAPVYTCSLANSCGYVVWGGTIYYHLQTHFHAPSEYKVNGVAYALDAHMVHQSASGAYLVYGVLFDTPIESGSNSASALLDRMFELIDASSTADDPQEIKFNSGNFIVEGSGFYNFAGSFTTPPCTEGVTWLVQATPVSVKSSQLEKFWEHIGGYPGNARDTQSLGTRTINFYVDNI